jgi:pimeloyl-ACP methyl ester carboxylesterase
LLAGCTTLPAPQERASTADMLAAEKGWHSDVLKTDLFLFRVYETARPLETEIITIYIEGDGLSWISRDRPSANPTPINPIGLKLALQNKHSAVYLARPCQFINLTLESNCNKKYWTSHRFSKEVIDSTNNAIEKIKAKYQAKRIILIGYSGGGTVATLVAARRSDIKQLITIAGNLDIDAWAKRHHLTTLDGSLNPADYYSNLESIDQTHLVGGKDTNISIAETMSYVRKFSKSNLIKVIVVDQYDHRCCWVEDWQKITNQYLMKK